MTPSSQGVEPATFPERFKVARAVVREFLDRGYDVVSIDLVRDAR
jgi:hypothetical protein